ncbi:MAG: hypothetical protein DDG60_08930 [Anaerolineae bacterium]|nr:MAG: hypothetical protein DDG60_08930 [Anaerolineae bacterium]
MSTLTHAEICFLLAFPDEADGKSFAEPVTGLKNAPYFQAVDIRLRTLGVETILLEGIPLNLVRQRYEQRVQMVECRFRLPDPLDLACIQKRQEIEDLLQERLLPVKYRSSGLFETYLVLMVRDEIGAPDDFVQANAAGLARFIRSHHEILDETEIDDVLISRLRYTKCDLTVVDWEGAVIFSPEGDFQSELELLKIGIYQLLRYRMLNQSSEEILQTISRIFQQSKFSVFGPTRATLRRIVNHRLDIMLEFEHTEQNLLLIGDWYTAKLYKIIRDEFYLDEWKQVIQDKLDNMERLISTIQENFSMTWSGFLDLVQLVGWLLLLVGYFILFFLQDIKPGH